MANPNGTPIWYELVTHDAAASKAFYEQVIGWTIHDAEPGGFMDYRMIDTGAGNFVGGLAAPSEKQRMPDMNPGWRFYIGVDDVDATAAKITDADGAIILPPFDLDGVGRMSLVADPQGIRFFIMRGASDQDSTAFERNGMGKCNWNELVTPDQAGGNAFYGEVFGWTYPDKMAMPGDMGDYVFVDVAGTQIGATMKAPPGAPAGWQFYFRTPDIEATAAKVAQAGGTVMMGPHDVPGGDRIIVAADDQGVVFGAVAPAQPA